MSLIIYHLFMIFPNSFFRLIATEGLVGCGENANFIRNFVNIINFSKNQCSFINISI
jgi:hypothetical protein